MADPTLTVGSLFSGIGGFELGLERTGHFRTVFQVEADPWARHILEKHWPGVPKFDDVRTVTAATLPACDVLCGGFPCQDISYAGKGEGLAGARSGLWTEFARLIGELRPRYVLVENVSALRSRGLGTVLGDLAARGYDAEWDCIPAAAVGAPILRDRMFIVAVPHGQSKPVLHHACGLQRGVTAPPTGPVDVGDKGRRTSRPFGWIPEPGLPRVAHGVPRRVDRLRGLGNAIVPQIATVLGTLIATHAHQQESIQ